MQQVCVCLLDRSRAAAQLRNRIGIEIGLGCDARGPVAYQPGRSWLM